MKKIILAILILTLLFGCLDRRNVEHPLMDDPAFDIIGDQGFKDDIVLLDLEGDYSCTLWLLDNKNEQVSAQTYACDGAIVENVLTLQWEMDENRYAFGKDLPFKLETGILFSEEIEPLLIAAVKVYPSGHMVDGVGTLVLDDSEVIRFHFQMVR